MRHFVDASSGEKAKLPAFFFITSFMKAWWSIEWQKIHIYGAWTNTNTLLFHFRPVCTQVGFATAPQWYLHPFILSVLAHGRLWAGSGRCAQLTNSFCWRFRQLCYDSWIKTSNVDVLDAGKHGPSMNKRMFLWYFRITCTSRSIQMFILGNLINHPSVCHSWAVLLWPSPNQNVVLVIREPFDSALSG